MSIKAKSLENFQVDIKSGQHVMRADEPISVGGDDTGPNPYDLLLASLAACKIITTQMYARRKGWPLTGVEIQMSTKKIHAKDCEDCESDPNAKIDIIETEISFEGDLDQEQLERLKDISEKCPVHRTLTSETKIRTKLV
ncbi:MAG: OsmC family protein [Chloroflexi bacterium]|nr:OsmC family protein [Chloroflexota bacterium]